CLLDTLGCGLFGATLPWSGQVADFAAELGGPPEATLWGRAERLPAANAALVNGTQVHGFELDDLQEHAIVHPGAVVVPVALGLAERAAARQANAGADAPSATVPSGAALLTAVAAGYEVACRVGASVGSSHLGRGFHPTGTCGAVAAAATAGR